MKLVPLVLSLTALASPAVASQATAMVLNPTTLHLADGRTLEGAHVVVSGGKITAVGKTIQAPQGSVSVDIEGHLSAGLIALSDGTGLEGERQDQTRWMMPEARMVDGFRSSHPGLKRLAESGVTAVVLTPGAAVLSGGHSAVVKTDGAVVNPAAHLHLNFSAAMFATIEADNQDFGGFRFFTPTRYPNGFRTSYSGALALLDDAFAEAKGPLEPVKKGERGVLLIASTRAEIARAAAFAKRHGLKGAIVAGSRAGELAEQLKECGVGVVLNPFQVGQSFRVARSTKQLADAGVPFGFALEAESHHPASLRLAAAAAIRAGVEPAQAWRALTADAATLAGVGGRMGDVAAGLDADLVLWSGPPAEPSSRVLTVWVGGKTIYQAEIKPAKEDE